MVFLESVTEIAVGIGVESAMLLIFGGVVYRIFSGRFVIPKREVVLPNQRGVIVEGERVVRVVEPGTCWVKPKQKVVLCDVRPRPLQLARLEVLGSNGGIVRLSLSGEYKIADAAIYYTCSTNAVDSLFVQIQRLLSTTARQELSATIVNSPETFAKKVEDALVPEASKLGFAILQLQMWDVVPVGWLQQVEAATSDVEDFSSGLIH